VPRVGMAGSNFMPQRYAARTQWRVCQTCIGAPDPTSSPLVSNAGGLLLSRFYGPDSLYVDNRPVNG
jgi:hypothetical protein